MQHLTNLPLKPGRFIRTILKTRIAFFVLGVISLETSSSFAQVHIRNQNSVTINNRSVSQGSSISSGTTSRPVRNALNIYNNSRSNAYLRVSCGTNSWGTITIPPRRYGYCSCSSGKVKIGFKSGNQMRYYQYRSRGTIKLLKNSWGAGWIIQR